MLRQTAHAKTLFLTYNAKPEWPSCWGGEGETMTFTEMINGAKAAHDWIMSVDSGQIACLLGDIEFEAARSAFAAVPSAVDKRGQVWVCVGHLNSCYHAYKKDIESSGAVDFMSIVRGAKILSVQTKARFALCLMAICYWYLEEQTLCNQHLELAGTPLDVKIGTIGKLALGAWWVSAAVFNPIPAIELLGAAVSGKKGPETDNYEVKDEQLASLRSILATGRTN